MKLFFSISLLVAANLSGMTNSMRPPEARLTRPNGRLIWEAKAGETRSGNITRTSQKMQLLTAPVHW